MIGDRIEVNIAGGLDIPLPRMVHIRQKFKTVKVDNVAATSEPGTSENGTNATSGDDPFTKEAQNLLRKWDYTQPSGKSPSAPAAAFYNAVWSNILELTFNDELGEEMKADGGSQWMQAVSALTERVLVLDQGRCLFDGPTAEGLARYRALQGSDERQPAQYLAPASGAVRSGNQVRAARVLTSEPGGMHRCGAPLTVEFDLEITDPASTLCFSCKLVDANDQNIAHLWCFDPTTRFRRDAGRYRLRFEVPRARLFLGAYTVRAYLSDRRTNTMYDELHGICPFEVTMDGVSRDDYAWSTGDCTYLESAEWILAREGEGAEQRGTVAP